MTYIRKRNLAHASEKGASPLDAAVKARDGSTMDMVEAAIKHREVILAYQPVMQARAPFETGFYEGLARVLDATGRVIPARDFMGTIANSETGRELDCLVLDIGMRTLSRNPGLRLSINMSARSIGYKKWMRILDRHLKKDIALGERLMLEISEASAMSVPELVLDFMDRLVTSGIAFALDDFGAGTTSFKHFRDFYFDAVKIDGQFVRNVSHNSDNQDLVCALVGVAKQFDMLTIANSVETVEDAEFLASIGVDCLQGYLFGAPTVHPPWHSGDSVRKRA